MLKAQRKPKPESPSKKMPIVICGGHPMEWDHYWAMLREMEKRQEPFKKWIEEEFMPSYKKFLQKKFTKRTAESHLRVAEIFFDRMQHVGFINFESIRQAFALKEFPRWWRTHVMDSSKTPTQIAASIKILLAFAKETYELEAIGKWPKK